MSTYLFSTLSYYISVFDSWLFVLHQIGLKKERTNPMMNSNCYHKINVNCRISSPVNFFSLLNSVRRFSFVSEMSEVLSVCTHMHFIYYFTPVYFFFLFSFPVFKLAGKCHVLGCLIWRRSSCVAETSIFFHLPNWLLTYSSSIILLLKICGCLQKKPFS